MKLNRISPHHILVITLRIQNKERTLKATREKHQVTYEGKSIRMTTDFSTETIRVGRALGYNNYKHICTKH
jgi:hypothetical protein